MYCIVKEEISYEVVVQLPQPNILIDENGWLRQDLWKDINWRFVTEIERVSVDSIDHSDRVTTELQHYRILQRTDGTITMNNRYPLDINKYIDYYIILAFDAAVL